jgi:hypothetical protein
MLKKILTGSESGSDQAAWRAANTFGVAVGGWMPEGFPTADGPRPEFAQQYGTTELPTDNRIASIEQNIHDSDATLWFGETTTEDAQTTVAACHRLGKPCMLIYPTAAFMPSHVAAWVRNGRIETLTVAGNREAVEPGIGDRVERFLGKVLQQLGYEQPRSHGDSSGPT